MLIFIRREKFGEIGLKDGLVRDAFSASKQLAMQVELLLQTVTSSRSLYDSFFLWLLKGTLENEM